MCMLNGGLVWFCVFGVVLLGWLVDVSWICLRSILFDCLLEFGLVGGWLVACFGFVAWMGLLGVVVALIVLVGLGFDFVWCLVLIWFGVWVCGYLLRFWFLLG